MEFWFRQHTTTSANKCAKKSSTAKTPEKCPAPETVCLSKEALMALGYELLPGFRYYKIIQKVNTYEDSKKLSEREGSHLLVLNSDDEAKALNAYLERLGLRMGFFVGSDNQKQEGEYRTIYGRTLNETGFSRSYPGEFTGKTGENCGLYYYDGFNYGLGDINCAAGGTWSICERDDL